MTDEEREAARLRVRSFLQEWDRGEVVAVGYDRTPLTYRDLAAVIGDDIGS